MSRDFKCVVCRRASERLYMRDMDGKWVCAHCIPDAELNRCPGLRERLGLQPGHARATSTQKRKAA